MLGWGIFRFIISLSLTLAVHISAQCSNSSSGSSLCSSWHAVFDLRQIVGLPGHPHLPNIVEKTNDNTSLLTYIRREGGAQLQQGFSHSDAVFEKSTFFIEMIFCACRAGEPCCFGVENFNELVYIGFSFCYFGGLVELFFDEINWGCTNHNNYQN